MAKDVMCEVETCSYWSNGNMCDANSINVVNNRNDHASTSGETDCQTFDSKM